MDIVYYRKCAEIMLRDGSTYEDRKTAARLLEARNPRRRDKKLVKAWMYRWCNARTATMVNALRQPTESDEPC